ncbi:MAG: PAS domain S-box protein [Burkholderiaceae bacterium]|nr:PAS domain S-box protein [Burkholderiaceae bacterium]
MDLQPPPSGPLSPHEALQQAIARTVFGVCAITCLAGVATVGLFVAERPAQVRHAMVGLYLLLATACLIGLRLPPRRMGLVLRGLVLGGLLLVAVNARLTGWGPATPGLVFYPVLVAVAGMLGSTGFALAAALLALGLSALQALSVLSGWMPGLPAAAPPPLLQAVAQGLAIVVGAVVGRAVARSLSAQLEALGTRERRFQSLLGIATAGYWETDQHLVLQRVEVLDEQGRFVPQDGATGRRLQELPRLQIEPEVAARLAQAMAAQQPLRDLAVAWHRISDGRWRHLLLSGEPRRDAAGRFAGYWGVVRDVSAEQQARAGLERSQALLAKVVETSPDVMTLTDATSGHYLLANQAFCRTLGYTLDQVLGRSSLELGIWRDPADRARLLQRLHNEGTALDIPVEFVAANGQTVPLQVSAARFERDGEAFIVITSRDVRVTQRLQLEREAMLANASIGIAFTRGQRFVLVNPYFEQMFRWPPGTLTGQPGRAVWPSDADYAELGAQVGPPLSRGQAVSVERRAQRADGTQFTVRMRAKAIDPLRPAEGGTIWIAEDVTAEREAAAQLARARDEAEAASRAKSAFLANTSHEIRTPLNGLVGLALLARRPDVEPERLRTYLDQIGESAQTLSLIINDILDLSKIEAGQLSIDPAPFDLAALLQSLHQSYGALAAARGLTFAMQIEAVLPGQVRGDALRVRQVLANLLHNALKFTVGGGLRLVLRPVKDVGGAEAEGQAGWLRFEVHDTGPGIAEADQQRLFQPFTQADESITRRYGGTGLGLSICRELCLLMGGRIGVASRPGAGSCFHVELPLPASQPAAGVPDEAASGEADARLAGARVLLVEDNAVNLMIAEALLGQWGLQVETAEDGLQALDAVARAAQAGRPYDLVLMDVQMPGISGYEATRRLRERWSAEQLPVIALTAAALVSERERALAHGMSDFLTKPIDAGRLRQALHKALHKRGQHHDSAASTAPL